MDIVLRQGINFDFIDKIKKISGICKLSNIEKMLSDCFEGVPQSKYLDYIGELNKNE
ncbi:hypothetical protein IJ541_04905 [bacterium]|nr:hypothetical protein [bacterium]